MWLILKVTDNLLLVSKQESWPNCTQSSVLWVYDYVYPQPHTQHYGLQTLNNRVAVFMEGSLSRGLEHRDYVASPSEAQWSGALIQAAKQQRTQWADWNDAEPFMLGPTAAKTAWLRGCPARGPQLQDWQGAQLSMNSVRLPKGVLSKLCFLIHRINLNG